MRSRRLIDVGRVSIVSYASKCSQSTSPTLRPNPSLKRTPNGLARRPSWAGASPHFAQLGRRAKPSVAA